MYLARHAGLPNLGAPPLLEDEDEDDFFAVLFLRAAMSHLFFEGRPPPLLFRPPLRPALERLRAKPFLRATKNYLH